MSMQGAVVRFMLRKSNIWNRPLNEIRTNMEAIPPKGMPAGIAVTRQEINGVACVTFAHSEKKSDSVMLYFHGGGFCLGIYHANREFVAMLAEKTGLDVYMPDYRLAPEHPFPAALEDAAAVYRGLLNTGLGAKDIFIAGDSSGCALAVSTLQILRQSGVEMPRAMVFLTPVIDLAGNGESFVSLAGKDPFRLIDPLGIAKLYVGTNNAASPVISPLYGEFDGLPPMLIHASQYDVFLSDAKRFACKAQEAGVPTELRVWDKMWHIFHMQSPFVPEAKQAIEEISRYICSLA